MAVGTGYSKVATNGLVFAYDTGDVVNSWKGKPTTNLLTGIGYSYGNQNGTYFKSQYGKETSYIPGLGGNVENDYCIFYNDYPGGSGNCCPSVFSFGNFSVSPSTTYTYQIIYKTPDGYANGNYMYHYEFGPGGYVTEYGLWDGSRTQDLGNGWVHAWGTFTSNANTNYFQCYLFHYQYTQTKIQVAGVMLTQGSNIIPPRQFLKPQESRSNNNALIDLSGQSQINVNSMSYISNGMIYFDGISNVMRPTTTHSYLNSSAMEVIFKYNGTLSGNKTIFGYRHNEGYSAPTVGSIYLSGNKLITSLITTSQVYRQTSSTANISTNTYYHVVFNKNVSNGTMQVYINGVLDSTQTFDSSTYAQWPSVGNFIGSNQLDIGKSTNTNAGQGWASDYFLGEISVAKIHSRVLTATEIRDNYNHYKTRFNLP